MSKTASGTKKTAGAGNRNTPAKAQGRRRPGRPKGSKGGTIDTITVEPSRCRRCGSTRRGDYYGKTEQAFRGKHNGQPFTHIVRRRTKCLDCGQTRIDRAYENRP